MLPLSMLPLFDQMGVTLSLGLSTYSVDDSSSEYSYVPIPTKRITPNTKSEHVATFYQMGVTLSLGLSTYSVDDVHVEYSYVPTPMKRVTPNTKSKLVTTFDQMGVTLEHIFSQRLLQ